MGKIAGFMRLHVLASQKENNISPPRLLDKSIEDRELAQINDNSSPDKTEIIPAIVDNVTDLRLNGDKCFKELCDTGSPVMKNILGNLPRTSQK